MSLRGLFVLLMGRSCVGDDLAKEVGSRLAPPTSAPSMSSRQQRLAALSGLTEPP